MTARPDPKPREWLEFYDEDANRFYAVRPQRFNRSGVDTLYCHVFAAGAHFFTFKVDCPAADVPQGVEMPREADWRDRRALTHILEVILRYTETPREDPVERFFDVFWKHAEYRLQEPASAAEHLRGWLREAFEEGMKAGKAASK